ncbi:MAG: DNA topoisomerase VI, partial [Candidatus Aenigmarchaeota archaeon]|nr:DNA topoisomerase VI [Candidatus Aenigmarchaeota archaeon]
QSESNPLIEDLEVALNLKREDLNLNTDRKGVVAGRMKIRDRFGGEETTIDCAKQGRSGWAIPSDVDNDMDLVDVDANYVLVVEKDALWQRLNEDKFWKKERCILITPKGQASRGCRRLINKLSGMGLPVYVFTDCDAWGWYIYWAIKTGSMNLAYLAEDIATPKARFVGVTMEDIGDYEFLGKLTIKAKPVDLKRAQEMMSYPWINRHKEWVRELKTVLKSKKKLEQDALQGPRLSFVGEYLRKKIKEKRFLP